MRHPPRTVFTFKFGPFYWSPFHYDCISGYHRVFWRFWIRGERRPDPFHTSPRTHAGLDAEEDF